MCGKHTRQTMKPRLERGAFSRQRAVRIAGHRAIIYTHYSLRYIIKEVKRMERVMLTLPESLRQELDEEANKATEI